MARSSGITSVAKSAAKVDIAKKKANLKRPSRKKYNDAEKKELSQLRDKNRYYRKRIAKILNDLSTTKITMEHVRHSLSQDLAYTCCQKGYFQKPDYDDRDIREWMNANGDSMLLRLVIDEYNTVNPGAIVSYDEDDETGVMYGKINNYNDLITENDKKIKDIEDEALGRKNEEMLKYLQDKQSIKDTKNLMQAISQGKIAIGKLSDPELAAVRFMKTSLINAVYSQIDFDSIPENYVPVIKRSIYAGIMENPVQGIRDALRGVAALKVAERYGNDAGDLAGGMMDFATSVMVGKPNVKSAAKTMFNYMVNKSSMNKSLMGEVAQELINSGESTSDKENAKMLARDILVDIGKNIITTGGNVFAAMPGIVRDIAIDAGQASVRKVKSDNNEAKQIKDEEKVKDAIEKAKKKAGNIDMDAIVSKFGS